MKSYAPVSVGSQLFTEGQMSLTMYAREFLAKHFAFDEFAHILWGVKKPTIVMTDKKALTWFFQSKQIPRFYGTTAIKRSSSNSSLLMS